MTNEETKHYSIFKTRDAKIILQVGYTDGTVCLPKGGALWVHVWVHERAHAKHLSVYVAHCVRLINEMKLLFESTVKAAIDGAGVLFGVLKKASGFENMHT